jgi:hypothetical protein
MTISERPKRGKTPINKIIKSEPKKNTSPEETGSCLMLLLVSIAKPINNHRPVIASHARSKYICPSYLNSVGVLGASPF